jgi:hypothetical protein
MTAPSETFGAAAPASRAFFAIQSRANTHALVGPRFVLADGERESLSAVWTSE